MNGYGEVMAASAAMGSQLGIVGVGEHADAAVPNVPDKRLKIGGVTATIWKGISPKGENYYNVQLAKSYKAKDGTWKTTHSLKEYEIPKAMVLLQKAYEYVMAQQPNAVLS